MKYLNSYSDKEQTEWSNFWYDNANLGGQKRFLLVGDSVARGCRRHLSEIMSCSVDLFATSAALRDQMYWDQWECFFKNKLYDYDAVIIWVGNHSRMSEDGKKYFTEYDFKRFQSDFVDLLERCKAISPNLIVLSTLHMFKMRKYNHDIERIRRRLMIKPKEYLDEIENVVVEGKNKIMKEVANEMNLLFYDIDKELMHSKFWHTDFIHYIPEGNIYAATLLKEMINRLDTK